jgi:hypothetical protein
LFTAREGGQIKEPSNQGPNILSVRYLACSHAAPQCFRSSVQGGAPDPSNADAAGYDFGNRLLERNDVVAKALELRPIVVRMGVVDAFEIAEALALLNFPCPRHVLESAPVQRMTAD